MVKNIRFFIQRLYDETRFWKYIEEDGKITIIALVQDHNDDYAWMFENALDADEFLRMATLHYEEVILDTFSAEVNPLYQNLGDKLRKQQRLYEQF